MNKNVNTKTICIVLAITILICALILLFLIITQSLGIEKTDNMSTTMRAVIIEVSDTRLWIVSPDNNDAVYYVGYDNTENTTFKKGQEILIYFSGWFYETMPGGLADVGKIEIIKEESDIEISEDSLRYFYSSKDNVSISINEFTENKLSISIIDTNDYKYDYSTDYIEVIDRDSREKFEITESISEVVDDIITKEYNWGEIYEQLDKR